MSPELREQLNRNSCGSAIEYIESLERALKAEIKQNQSGLEEAALDHAAREIWESESHPLLSKAGHAVDWENLNSSVKRSVIRKARLAIKAYNIHVKAGD